jgi:hypothetical protein
MAARSTADAIMAGTPATVRLRIFEQPPGASQLDEAHAPALRSPQMTRDSPENSKTIRMMRLNAISLMLRNMMMPSAAPAAKAAEQSANDECQAAFPLDILAQCPEIGCLHADTACHHQRHRLQRGRACSRMAPATAENAKPAKPETSAPENAAALSRKQDAISVTILILPEDRWLF